MMMMLSFTITSIAACTAVAINVVSEHGLLSALEVLDTTAWYLARSVVAEQYQHQNYIMPGLVW
jgi:hypothetical protein